MDARDKGRDYRLVCTVVTFVVALSRLGHCLRSAWSCRELKQNSVLRRPTASGMKRTRSGRSSATLDNTVSSVVPRSRQISAR